MQMRTRFTVDCNTLNSKHDQKQSCNYTYSNTLTASSATCHRIKLAPTQTISSLDQNSSHYTWLRPNDVINRTDIKGCWRGNGVGFFVSRGVVGHWVDKTGLTMPPQLSKETARPTSNLLIHTEPNGSVYSAIHLQKHVQNTCEVSHKCMDVKSEL